MEICRGIIYKVFFARKRGSALVYAIVVSSFILLVAMSIFEITFGELKISGDIRESFTALFAADEMFERALYLDRTLHAICYRPSADCFVRYGIISSNNGSSSVAVSKDISKTQITVTGDSKQNPNDSFLVKRSFSLMASSIEFDRLMAWWKFDETPLTNQNILDSTPNANNGFLGTSGTVQIFDPERLLPSPAIYGTALRFTSTQADRAIATDTPTLNLQDNPSGWPMSITSWICVKSNTGAKKAILKKGAVTAETYGFYYDPPFWDPLGELYFEFKDPSTGTTYRSRSQGSGGSIAINQWYYVAVTYDGSGPGVRFYKNGVFISSVPQTANLQPTGVPAYIGFDLDDQSTMANFEGYIDEVKLYKVALTDDEVRYEFNGTKPSAGPWAC